MDEVPVAVSPSPQALAVPDAASPRPVHVDRVPVATRVVDPRPRDPIAPVLPKPTAKPMSDIERVRELMLQVPPGYQQARSILEPKVFGNRASQDEIRALRLVCKQQGDKQCAEALKPRLTGDPSPL